MFPAAAEAAREALRIDPGLGAAHSSLGYVALYYEWDFSRADREFRQAIALDPNDGLSRQWYGNYLTAMGRFEEAEQEVRRARSLDPFRTFARAVLGWVWFYSGDYERAADQLATTIEMSPETAMVHMWRGQALEMLGRQAEALEAYRRGVELSDEGAVFLAALARGYALAGDPAEAARLLTRIESGRHVPAYEIAKVHVALGDRPEALRWLTLAVENRAHSLVFLRVDPQLATLKGDPAFEQIANRVGL